MAVKKLPKSPPDKPFFVCVDKFIVLIYKIFVLLQSQM